MTETTNPDADTKFGGPVEFAVIIPSPHDYSTHTYLPMSSPCLMSNDK